MNNKLCAAPFVSFYTGLNHQVKSCCAMMDPIGYSNEDTFENIMNSETSKRIFNSVFIVFGPCGIYSVRQSLSTG